MKKTKMLKKNYEFKNVLNRGKYYTGRYMIAFIKRNNQHINFLGIAIRSKLAKAVKRNYMKRIIRESYKSIEDQLQTGYSIVFLWKNQADIKQACYENVKKDIIKIFKEAGTFLEE